MKEIDRGTLGREGKDRATQIGCSLGLDVCESMKGLLKVLPRQRKCIRGGVRRWERT